MKRAIFILLFCGIAFSVSGQGKLLKTLKKVVESSTGLQVSNETVFVYPEVGAWNMSLISCDGNPVKGEVVLRIKAMPLLQSPGNNVRCYILNAADPNGHVIKTAPWGTAGQYNFAMLTNREIEFQPMLEVPGSTKTLNVKFVIGEEAAATTFELRNVPINWNTASLAANSGQGGTVTVIPGKITSTRIEETITDTTTVKLPDTVEISMAQKPGHTDKLVIGGGYSLEKKRTSFFYFDDPGDELEVIDIDLFNPNQFVYSLCVGLKNKRFPVERAYENLGDVSEDERTKDFYMKHMAKCLVVTERGNTPAAERDAITENYLYLAINKFANDNADNGLYMGTEEQRLIPRKALVESVLRTKLNTDEEIIKALDDGQKHIIDYITAHPPQKSTMPYMGDSKALQYNFEYRFYDKEMFLHAFVFSPITLHYEIRTWYDDVNDITVYAYFYCVGYDNANMKQVIGENNYNEAKESFKTRNKLDFDQYPLKCLITGFEDKFKLLRNAPVITEIYFPGPISWFKSEKKGKTETIVRKQTITHEVVKQEPEKYKVSSNSAAYLSGINVVDIAEDSKYTYLAGSVEGTSKIFAVEKSGGEIIEIYKTTHGDRGDKGDVKRLMNDGNGKVLVEFSKYPAMLLSNCLFEDTKLHIRANDENLQFYLPKLKAVMPDGSVVLIENALGNQNTLVDPKTGNIRASSKEMSFNDQIGKVAVTNDWVIWEPGSGSYTRVSGFGTASQPTFTKFDTGYDSPLKGGVNEIKVAINGDLYIASRFGLHKSTDNGKNWRNVKSIYNYGSFDRIAPNSKSEVWAATNTAAGYSVVRYNEKLDKIVFRTSEFDVLKDGSKLKLQTAPRLLFVDSLDNLWIVGGTYGAQVVLMFNAEGVMGYNDIASKKIMEIQ